MRPSIPQPGSDRQRPTPPDLLRAGSGPGGLYRWRGCMAPVRSVLLRGPGVTGAMRLGATVPREEGLAQSSRCRHCSMQRRLRTVSIALPKIPDGEFSSVRLKRPEYQTRPSQYPTLVCHRPSCLLPRLSRAQATCNQRPAPHLSGCITGVRNHGEYHIRSAAASRELSAEMRNW